MMDYIITSIRNNKFLIKTITIALMIMMNSGCTYKHVSPVATIELELAIANKDKLLVAMQDFADEYGLVFKDGTIDYPSGNSPILYELFDNKGTNLLQVNDLMDQKRYIISVYEAKHHDWEKLYEQALEFLLERFSGEKIKGKKKI